MHFKRSKNTFELTIPYQTLDARTVNLVLKSKVQNQKAIFEEIEKHNMALQQQNQKQVMENIRRKYES